MPTIVINISTQTLQLGERSYPISSAKNGLGETLGSFKTPRGRHEIYRKIGAEQAIFTVFKGRVPTGEIWSSVLSLAEGDRDFILSRILWLSGPQTPLERYIYIHGTHDEAGIGQPKSHGCIRMRNHDVIDLFERVFVKDVVIIKE